jgi:hypothetical protein
MRSLLVLAFAFGSIVAAAQQPANSSQAPAKGWDTVRALPPDASLDIKLRHGGQKCSFRSADADTLTCQHGTDLTLQRADVLQIKIHHRGRSTLAGLAIGAGGGALIGAAATPSCNNFCIVGGKGFGATVVGIAGGGVGAITGYFSDFTRSVVYKAN